jgi:hypothetical protein
VTPDGLTPKSMRQSENGFRETRRGASVPARLEKSGAIETNEVRPRILGRRLSSESGQTVVLMAAALVLLLGLAAFSVDVGYAYFARRSLQASADAAALAGAQRLPDSATATATARDYGTSGKNRDDSFGDVDETISLRCVSSLPGCDPYNAVAVQESAHVPTFFGRVLGIDSFNIKAKATAAYATGIKPADIMLVVDRTGSMCTDDNLQPFPDGECDDLINEQNGLKTFLGLLDPSAQYVGLVLFPPARSNNACAIPNGDDAGSYYQPNANYVAVPLSSNYATKPGTLDPSSQLVSTINCFEAAGSTAYATAIDKAQAELQAHGRPDAQHIIVFFSDGAANVGPLPKDSSSPYWTQPCHQGVTSAGWAKTAGTVIYSIGFGLDAEGANVCYNGLTYKGGSNGTPEEPTISAEQALGGIASSTDDFYNKPSDADLSNVYRQIAASVSQGTSSLIPDDSN